MGTYLATTESYLRLALKAQAQSRATVEALAEMKNPHPVSFVKQANIAHGNQQVNNGGKAADWTESRATRANSPKQSTAPCDSVDADVGTQRPKLKQAVPSSKPCCSLRLRYEVANRPTILRGSVDAEL